MTKESWLPQSPIAMAWPACGSIALAAAGLLVALLPACSSSEGTPPGTNDSPAGSTSGGSGGSAGSAIAGTSSTPGGEGSSAAGGGGSGGAGGVSGSSGAAGTAGAGGSAQDPAAELDGAGWTFECTRAEGGDLCAVLPPAMNECPNAGYFPVDETLTFGGTPGTVYDVTIHFQGTHEAGDYVLGGGTADPPQFLRGATRNEGLHTWLYMEVSAPAMTYFPNAGGNGGSVQIYDYEATIPIEGGATIKLKGFDIDCLMHRYCQDGNTNPCKGLVIDGISPANDPIDGAFLHMTVKSVVAR